MELKHLAPYLPYGLEVENLNYKCDYVGKRYGILNNIYALETDKGKLWHYKTDKGNIGALKDCKPVLYQLKNLTKGHAEACGYESKLDLLEAILFDKISLTIFNDLIKNHWDVFGLIEKGEAILKPKPI